MTHHTSVAVAAALAVALLSASALAADVEMKTEGWATKAPEFEKMVQRIEAGSGRNLLARSGVRVFGNVSSPREL
ncbi:MAG: hypothetical protein NT049_13315, partial [Planctomycetota bacterium]|nr:hypothetical protein [Planctomycetota bacterium]